MVPNLMLGEDGKYEAGLLIPQCYWISLPRKMANYTDDSCVCQQLGGFFWFAKPLSFKYLINLRPYSWNFDLVM